LTDRQSTAAVRDIARADGEPTDISEADAATAIAAHDKDGDPTTLSESELNAALKEKGMNYFQRDFVCRFVFTRDNTGKDGKLDAAEAMRLGRRLLGDGAEVVSGVRLRPQGK
jgi:hypothetical protein